MKRKFNLRKSNWITKIFAIIFPTIILTGCPAMYGSPYASYTTSGCVTTERGRPLEGIKVSVSDHSYTDSLGQKELYFAGYAITDGNGEYVIDFNSDFMVDMIVIAEDIDGEEGGGEYQNDTIIVERVFEYKGGGYAFYGGHADIPDINFKLKKK
ncbi:MAG TPA: radical SAM-associated putative lipoprotein [Bacteroidales bacterium]|jgi:putative lipoprotein (rSAM/lipoprotein system)|nr:radical SAM-associated putative lipoprotein [Bacteroidales bacterium]